MAVSSLAGKLGVPTRSGYSASKHAMAGFFDSLRIELVHSGVSVTITYPGFVTSEIRARAYGADGKPLGKSPVREAEVMSAEECARIMVKAMARRKREEVMTLRGKLGDGASLNRANKVTGDRENTKFDALKGIEVTDVTGAGDVFLAALVKGIVDGMLIDDAIRVANICAGKSVTKFGTVAVSYQDYVDACGGVTT